MGCVPHRPLRCLPSSQLDRTGSCPAILVIHSCARSLFRDCPPRPCTAASVNGLWEWESSTAGAKPTFGQKLTGEILVPFPVESCLSGIGANHPDMFYRTLIKKAFRKGTTLLHFEAVDWQVMIALRRGGNGREWEGMGRRDVRWTGR